VREYLWSCNTELGSSNRRFATCFFLWWRARGCWPDGWKGLWGLKSNHLGLSRGAMVGRRGWGKECWDVDCKCESTATESTSFPNSLEWNYEGI
jgi:hypothetical protein